MGINFCINEHARGDGASPRASSTAVSARFPLPRRTPEERGAHPQDDASSSYKEMIPMKKPACLLLTPLLSPPAMLTLTASAIPRAAFAGAQGQAKAGS